MFIMLVQAVHVFDNSSDVDVTFHAAVTSAFLVDMMRNGHSNAVADDPECFRTAERQFAQFTIVQQYYCSFLRHPDPASSCSSGDPV